MSQEWEEVYVFVNDGRGRFEPRLHLRRQQRRFRIELDHRWPISTSDGDVDVLYSNGDAFDYAPPSGRQLERRAVAREHRAAAVHAITGIADFSGASSPQAGDLDGDGDLDIAVVSAYNDWDDPAAQSLVWLENDGRMRFTLHDVASTPTHLVTLAIGDLTGDGAPDLVTGGMHISWPYDRHVADYDVDEPVERRHPLGMPAWGLAVVAAVAVGGVGRHRCPRAACPRGAAAGARTEAGAGGGPRSDRRRRSRGAARALGDSVGAPGVGLSRQPAARRRPSRPTWSPKRWLPTTGDGRICGRCCSRNVVTRPAPTSPSSR